MNKHCHLNKHHKEHMVQNTSGKQSPLLHPEYYISYFDFGFLFLRKQSS